MGRKIKVGLFGTSIPGLIEGAINSYCTDGSIEFVEINTSERKKGNSTFSFLMTECRKWLKLCLNLHKIDVLVIVFVGPRSNLAASIAHIFHVKVIFYWLGSDVFALLNGKMPALEKGCEADLHLAYGENLISELKQKNIEADLLITPPDLPVDVAKMPSSHAVLLSIPDSSREFYGYNAFLNLIQSFPDTPFYIVRSEREDLYKSPNVVFKGMLSREEMNTVFNNISISIRFPEHDGTSLVMMESLIKGKLLISKSDFPYAVKANNYDELRDALASLLDKPLVPNIEGHRYALKAFSRREAGRKWFIYLSRLAESRG